MTLHPSSSFQSCLSHVLRTLSYITTERVPCQHLVFLLITVLCPQNARCFSIPSHLTHNGLIPHPDPSLSISPPNPFGITVGHLHWRPLMDHTPSHRELYLSMSYPGPEGPTPTFWSTWVSTSLPRACVNLPSL